jgi:hypothetical protein
MMNAILVICAWCEKTLGKKPADREIKSTEDTISHGMCKECFDEVHESFKEKFPKTEE